MNRYGDILKKLTALCGEMEEVRAGVIIGSRARGDRPADAFSDLDIILVVSDVNLFLSADAWLHRLGDYHISFVENTSTGDKERRVLFEGALDVDIVLLDERRFFAAADSGAAAEIVSRGYKILVDKIGAAECLERMPVKKPAPLTEIKFQNLTNDFWYDCVWSGKKLLRGELWASKSCLDAYMKGLLLRMMEYHAKALHGPGYDTWHDGRFLDQWLDPRLCGLLAQTFGPYTRSDAARALRAMMELFRLLSAETAALLHFLYPEAADKEATAWVDEHFPAE